MGKFQKVWTGRIVVAVLALGMVAASTGKGAEAEHKVQLDLQLKALLEPLQGLTAADRQTVDEAINLIKQKEHGLALARLTGLAANNPRISALRVLRAYTLLELGNVTGALEEAKAAEGLDGHSGYKCWFLAQVAYVAGNKPLCRREIKHLTGGAYEADAEKLRVQLDGKAKK